MTRLVCAWVVVNGVLLAPAWLSAAVTGAPTAAWISLEAGLIAGGMALLPRRTWSLVLTWVAAIVVVLTATIGSADLVFRVSLGRSLNLSVDLYLLDAVRRLAIGNAGMLRTILLSGALAIAGGVSLFAIARLLAPAAHDETRNVASPVPRVAWGIVVGSLVLSLMGSMMPPVGARVGAPALSLLREQVALAAETRAERARFAADLAASGGALEESPRLLDRLQGRSVVLAYLESYGMAALDDAELSAVVRPHLEVAADRLEDAGVQLATGRLISPTLGGQSWYAHGTMLSGLWLENQLRYELLLSSGYRTLVDDFHRVGYRAVTIMPAITTAWPEATRLGFDDVYTSQNIPYAGPPFYWVTMPDQFTWSFLGDVLRRARAPLFAQVGMVSSHAPWTPVLPLVPWDEMGDGSVFEPYRLEGYPPEEIWWDVGVLREGYARSVAYSIDAMAEFAERFLDDETLLIVSGDHQAAPWVTGASGAEVPVHVIARDPALVRPFLDWGFRPGPFPGPEGSAHRMDEFREWLVRAYSGGT